MPCQPGVIIATLNDLDGITNFLAVAEQRSFTAAAAQLGVTTAAVSKTVRQLELRHAVALFQRTTRRVALTEAGASLFARLRPAATEIAEALAALDGHGGRPRGTLRITAPHSVNETIMSALLPAFCTAYPDVALDIESNESFVDLIANGSDAGIRLGEAVEKDMIAVRMTPEIRWKLVATPAYFKRHGRPGTPADLLGHEAIRYRFPGSRLLHR
ncbi:LysR family transcriptional regulator [Massilia sp. CMS3.1]|uniref:LysR family transcriptional regulator n=1 Tax=Massilia sp. CMS3.1 TaxID=3373083 RepID=UPI003EE51C9C